MSEDDEIVQAFLEESRENLDQLDRDLVELESRPDDPAVLARVFRTIHTIKGTCGFLGYRRLESLTHAGENLLGALRAGELTLDGPVTTTLLTLVDATRAVLRHIERRGVEGDDEHASVIADLVGHLAEHRPAASPPPSAPSTGRPEVTAVVEAARVVEAATVAAAVEAGTVVVPAAAQHGPDGTGAGAETSVRVDVAVLDKLLDLVGELVLTRSQIGDLALADDDGPLALPYRQLRLVTGELQDGVMRARLQPVGAVSGKFRRVARDLAAALGKKLRVELEGEDVGVDKAVNEALRDPLLHLVRNAVDHGLEGPAERMAAGKPAEGLLRIRAHHEGGRVHVEVSDDGRGIDGDRLAACAVAAGDLTTEEAAGLTAAQRLELMFRPGLSTKDEVTSVSGRGVGMDVVRTDLEQVGGRIEVVSDPGKGTVFRINVPLTLAIMPALVVWCGGGRYAVPQVDLQEIVHLDPDQVAATVDDVDGVRLHRLGGRLLPLIELAHQLRVPARRADAGLDVVVVRSGGRRFGLAVDSVGDTIEAVVKPLPRAVRSVAVFAGVTILGDGQPALVLDMGGLAAGVAVEARSDEGDDGAADVALLPGGGGLLLATGAGGGALAFRLDSVRRLEQFPTAHVERAGGTEVVQYGDTILPLIRVHAALSGGTGGPEHPSGLLAAVVCTSSVGPVALIVDRIEDVVAEPPAPAQPTTLPGVTACVIVGGRVTEVVDVEALVLAAGLARTA